MLLVSVSAPEFQMPPPTFEVTLPFDIVRPEMLTVVPELILKMRKFGAPELRCTVSRLAPGPVIVRFLLISNSALVSVIGLTTPLKLIVIVPQKEADALTS